MVRFRPLDDEKRHLKNKKEFNFQILDAKSIALRSRGGITEGNNNIFHLDSVLDDQTTQRQVFESVGDPIVRDVLQGFNGTIFVYGQTGSGKTHTLFGDLSHRDALQRGIIPRSCHRIFEHFEYAQDIDEVSIKCSFIEIYLEKLQDLLCPRNNDILKIRRHTDATVYVEGLHEEFVSCFNDVYELLQIGFRNRVVRATLMNQESSRSHCVLILRIKQILKDGTTKVSTINFADLAGSEKVKKTKATGDTLKQAQSINKSLSALGNVISALSSSPSISKGGRVSRHVPYRDSQLTHLLKDSLMGNTKTTLVVACSSDVYNLEETITSLRFATRAKKVVNNVKVNKVQSIVELVVMITMLKKKLKAERTNNVQLRKQLNNVQSRKQLESCSNRVAKTDEVEIDVSGSEDQNKNAIYDLEQMIEKMRTVMDTKDQVIAKLNDEIRSLKQNTVNCNKCNHGVAMSTSSSPKQSVADIKGKITKMLGDEQRGLNRMNELLEREDMMQETRMSTAKKSMFDEINRDKRDKLIDCLKLGNQRYEMQEDPEHVTLIERLKWENEHLKQDRDRLMQWNKELKRNRRSSEPQIRRSRVISPVYVRQCDMALIPAMHPVAESSHTESTEIPTTPIKKMFTMDNLSPKWSESSLIQSGLKKQTLNGKKWENQVRDKSDGAELWERLREAADRRGLQPIRNYDGTRAFEMEVLGNKAAQQTHSLISGIWPEAARTQLSNRNDDEMMLLCTYETLSIDDLRTYLPEHTMLEVRIGDHGDCWWFQVKKCKLISVPNASATKIKELKCTWGEKRLPKQWLFEFEVTKMHESASTIPITPRHSPNVITTGRSARRKRYNQKKRIQRDKASKEGKSEERKRPQSASTPVNLPQNVKRKREEKKRPHSGSTPVNLPRNVRRKRRRNRRKVKNAANYSRDL